MADYNVVFTLENDYINCNRYMPYEIEANWVPYLDGFYYGELCHGVPDGYGKFCHTINSYFVLFEGRWKDGKIDSGECCQMPMGDMEYTGRIRKGLPHRYGTYYYMNSIYYQGELHYGRKHGQGVGVHNNQIYVGWYRDNRRCGNGRLFDLDGRFVESGIWEDDIKIQ